MTEETNHDLKECTICAWSGGRSSKSCQVFKNKKNVILDENGRCNAFAGERKKRKIQRDCRAYSLGIR